MTDIVQAVPAVIRILLVFTMILAAIKRKWMLGNAFIAGAVALGFLFAMTPVGIAGCAVTALVHPKTLSLSIIVGLILVFSHSLEQSGQMARLLDNFKELGLILALVIAIAWVWRANGMPRAQCLAILRQPALYKMLYMVGAILVFKGALEQSGAVAQISREMLHWRIPLMTIGIMLPLLVGSIAGMTIAFVGTTFPILVSLIQAMGQTHLMLPYMMLAMASGFVGVLVSPLHLCLQLSNAYFSTSLVPVYRHMWLPLIALLGSGAAYFGGLYYWMN